MNQRISIIALDECSGSVLMGVVDLFNTANVIWQLLTGTKEKLFDTQTVSPGGQSVQLGNGYTISVDGGLNLIGERDGLFLVPFATSSSTYFLEILSKQRVVIDWLEQRQNKFDFIAAVSVSVFLLAEAGLLRDKCISTAWWFDSVFKERFPDLTVDDKTVFFADGNILTTGAANGFQDIGMEIVERVAGKTFAVSMSRYMMNDYERRSAVPQFFSSQIHTSNIVVNQADAWIQKNIANDIRIDDLAEHVAVSPRTLARYFKSVFGDSPQQYIQKSRVEKGKLLLEITDLDISQIAYRCGYEDPGTYGRLFKRLCGVSPLAYRDNLVKHRT